MTFADVARRVGLNTTSVTYYFKRKEDLAAAAFETHARHADRDARRGARGGRRREARVARYLALNMERLARIERGEERAFAVLSDLRATEEPIARPADGGLARRIPQDARAVGRGRDPRADRSVRRARARAAGEHLLAAGLADPLRARPICRASRRG